MFATNTTNKTTKNSPKTRQNRITQGTNDKRLVGENAD